MLPFVSNSIVSALNEPDGTLGGEARDCHCADIESSNICLEYPARHRQYTMRATRRVSRLFIGRLRRCRRLCRSSGRTAFVTKSAPPGAVDLARGPRGPPTAYP